MDFKDIKPVKPKGNEPWIILEKTEAETEAQYFGHLMQSQLIRKDPGAGKD